MIAPSWLNPKQQLVCQALNLVQFTTQNLDDWHGWMTRVDDSPAVIGKFKGLSHCVKHFYNDFFHWIFWNIFLRKLVLIHTHRVVKKPFILEKRHFYCFFHKSRNLNQFFQKPIIQSFPNCRFSTISFKTRGVKYLLNVSTKLTKISIFQRFLA